MTTTINFRYQDHRGCPNRLTGDYPFTDQTLKDVLPSAANVDFIQITLAATSPASWSSGRYYLSLRLDFYTDDGIFAGFNTLVSQVAYPLLQWNVGETSTVKKDTFVIPVNLLDKKYKVRAQLVSGQGSYVFTGIDGLLYIYGRADT
jgi:hypothetical protein